MKNTKEIRKSIVVLVVICLLTSAALAVVNHFTAPVSKANAEARAEQARLDAVPDAASFQLVETTLPEEVVSAYLALDEAGSPMSYLFTVEGKGFGGTIQVFVPQAMVEDYRRGIDAVLGDGACHLLSIRPVGGMELVPAESAN